MLIFVSYLIFVLSAVLFLTSLVILGFGIFDGFEEEFLICFTVFLVGAINLLALGILGQYIGRIYDETRNRPLYIVKNSINL